jgi:stage V sporulation protein R
MEVRRTHMDWFFIDEFLNRDVVDELQLYIYQESDQGSHIDLKVGETDWRKIKQVMVQSLMNWGIPRILVVDGNYRNSSQLYLKHEFEGMPLDDEYCRRTLEHIHFLWGRPTHLETLDAESSRKVVYSADQDGVHRVLRAE